MMVFPKSPLILSELLPRVPQGSFRHRGARGTSKGTELPLEGLVLGWGAGGWGPGSWVLALAASCPGTSPCPSAGLSVYSVPLPL